MTWDGSRLELYSGSPRAAALSFYSEAPAQRAVPQAASRRAPAPEQQEAEESWLPPVPLAHSGHSQWPYPQVLWGPGDYLQGLL